MDARVLWVLARQELREAGRKRWFLSFAAVFCLLALAFSYFGLSGLGTFGISGFGRTAASLMQLGMLIVPLMGLLVGAQSIAGERERGTLTALLAQPVAPTEVFIGKFLGSALALACAMIVGVSLSGAVIAAHGGFMHLPGYLGLLGLMVLLGLAHVALGLLISTLTRHTTTAVGAALVGWLAVVVMSDLGVMGTAMVLKLSPPHVLWLSCLNPAQIFRLGAIGGMQGALEALGPAGRYAATVVGAWLVPVMTGLLMLWIVIPLTLARQIFIQRGAV